MLQIIALGSCSSGKFKASNAFYSGDTDECAGPRGQIVELCDYTKGKNHLLQIEKILNKLVIAEGIKEHEISILTGSSINNSPFNSYISHNLPNI